MQATVASFSADSRTGVVLRDDGSALPFDESAFAAGGLRLLRVGQRVRLEVDDDGTITVLTILTMQSP